jgi:AcrR family transcriptional regulator
MPIEANSRSYRSPARRAQADATRRKMLDAARALLPKLGYEATTINAVADQAGVAVQTVYAAFGSKRGIIAALLDEVRFGEPYKEAVRQARGTTDLRTRLRFAASIACKVHDAERAEIALLHGIMGVSPELAQIEADAEMARRDAQLDLVSLLVEAGAVKPGLDMERARDVLWAFTGRDLYRMLVVTRRWSTEAYEHWLAALLERELLP